MQTLAHRHWRLGRSSGHVNPYAQIPTHTNTYSRKPCAHTIVYGALARERKLPCTCAACARAAYNRGGPQFVGILWLDAYRPLTHFIWVNASSSAQLDYNQYLYNKYARATKWAFRQMNIHLHRFLNWRVCPYIRPSRTTPMPEHFEGSWNIEMDLHAAFDYDNC